MVLSGASAGAQSGCLPCFVQHPQNQSRCPRVAIFTFNIINIYQYGYYGSLLYADKRCERKINYLLLEYVKGLSLK